MGTSSSSNPCRCHSWRALAGGCLAVLLAVLPGWADPAGGARLEAIYPSAELLPANHLKFYLHFSVPMREGVFLDHCQLLDDHGRVVIAEPFRETELWSED